MIQENFVGVGMTAIRMLERDVEHGKISPRQPAPTSTPVRRQPLETREKLPLDIEAKKLKLPNVFIEKDVRLA